MVIVIDNYDSFTYNLVQRLGEIDPTAEIRVFRNDDVKLSEIDAMSPSRILVSPGPCTPNEAGISVDCIKRFAGRVPILGVCLGHQSIAMAYGANIIKSKFPVHGKVSNIFHKNSGIFRNLPNPFYATRYHSLIVDKKTLIDDFEITAWTDDLIMGLKHKSLGLEGVQFHPESILTESGFDLLRNFLNNYAKI